MADHEKRHITAVKPSKSSKRAGGGPKHPEAPGGAPVQKDGHRGDDARPDQLTLDEALDAQAEFLGRAFGALIGPPKPKAVATRSRPIRKGKAAGRSAARFELLYFVDGKKCRKLWRVMDTNPGQARRYAHRAGIPVGTEVLVRCRRTSVGFWITVIPPIGEGES